MVAFATDDGEREAEGDAGEIAPDLRVGCAAEGEVSACRVEEVAGGREAEEPAVVAVVISLEIALFVACLLYTSPSPRD